MFVGECRGSKLLQLGHEPLFVRLCNSSLHWNQYLSQQTIGDLNQNSLVGELDSCPAIFPPYASLCALHMICHWNVIFERDVATISHLLQVFFTPLFTGKIVASLLPECRAHYIIDAPEDSASRVFSLFRIVSLSFLRSRSAFFIANIRFFPVSIILGGKKSDSRNIRLKKTSLFIIKGTRHSDLQNSRNHFIRVP